MRTSEFLTREFLEEIIPRLKDFGRYALAIQKTVYFFNKSDEKTDPASAIVTDADFMVQEGLLRVIKDELGHKEIEIGVEENLQRPSLHESHSEVRIEIDPIDCTSAYKRGVNNWCIILSVYKRGFLDGALVHTPWDGKIYCASRATNNSFFYDSEGNRNNLIIALKPGRNKMVLTHFLPKEKQKKLEDLGIDVSQANEEGKAGRYPHIGLNGIFRGELCAWFKQNAPARDWGSMAFIVEKAGGIVTDYNGNKLEYNFFNRRDKTLHGCLPSVIVSLDKELHKSIVEVLSKK